MRKMRVINLYGGPGTGKSREAAACYARLKSLGYNAEMCREWPKGPVWDKYNAALEDQFYILGKHLRDLARCARGGVEVAVSDSPLLLSRVYGAGEGQHFMSYVSEVYNRYENTDVYLKRVNPYNSAGRTQTEDEAIALDGLVRAELALHNTAPWFLDGFEGVGRRVAELFHVRETQVARQTAQERAREALSILNQRQAAARQHVESEIEAALLEGAPSPTRLVMRDAPDLSDEVLEMIRRGRPTAPSNTLVSESGKTREKPGPADEISGIG